MISINISVDAQRTERGGLNFNIAAPCAAMWSVAHMQGNQMADENNMPNEFLTGIRNLRSSFLSGAMLIASIYILAIGKFESSLELKAPATRLLKLHDSMPIFITALAAYLIGSLYVTALEGVVDFIHRKRLSLDTEDNRSGPAKALSEAFSPLSHASARRLKVEVARFFREKKGPEIGVADDVLEEFTKTVFADILWMEGKLAGTNLREIYAEYRAEGEFRLSIGLLLPLVAYAIAYSISASGCWLFAFMFTVCVISVQTCNYGLYYFRRAHSFLAHHVSDGNLLTPSMETLKQASGK